jgi:hypothetical protein
LDVDDDDKLPGDKFWNSGTPENAESFVLSIYQALRKATTSNGFYLYSGDFRCAPLTTIPATKMQPLLDNLMKTYQGNYDSSQAGTSSECGAIQNWKQMYTVIQSANIMIEEVENILELSSVEQDAYRVECVFLRSLAYFYLVRLFGDVPYYTEAYSSKSLPRTSMQTVLKSCLNDMQAVIDNDPGQEKLPWRKKGRNLRANRGAMLTLMMHINMWLAGFDRDNAAAYYGEVKRLAEIDSWIDGTYYSLLPIEQSSNIFRGESEEGLFEIAQSITDNEIFATSHMWSQNVVYEILTKTTPSYIYSKAFLKKLYPMEEGDLFPDDPGTVKDKRKQYWFKNLFYDEDTGDILETSSFNEIEIVKMLNSDKSGSTVVANAGNYIVFRYADAILLYAEALEKLGDVDKALSEVNRIRERAEASPFTVTGDEYGNDLEACIYWERVRELMGEGQYFYDLVRTEKLCDANFATFTDGSGHREKRSDFLQGSWTWPIFKGALDNNPNISKNLYWE